MATWRGPAGRRCRTDPGDLEAAAERDGSADSPDRGPGRPVRAEARQLPMRIGAMDVAALVPEASAALPRAQSCLPGPRVLKVEARRARPARADRDRLVQIVGNYVSNALRYAPSPSIRSRCPCRAALTRWWSRSDEGPGLADEQLAHLFERFYRATRRAPGHFWGFGDRPGHRPGACRGHGWTCLGRKRWSQDLLRLLGAPGGLTGPLSRSCPGRLHAPRTWPRNTTDPGSCGDSQHGQETGAMMTGDWGMTIGGGIWMAVWVVALDRDGLAARVPRQPTTEGRRSDRDPARPVRERRNERKRVPSRADILT